jgi:glycosyltransferase involved in cell wall biosynthesis
VCWLCHEILPQVRRLVGREVGCRIIGGDAPKQVERLAAIPGITVEGYEPELRDAYARAAVVVAPMRFVAGMQNKVLEAMACEAPVVATPYANEGIGAAPGREIEVAATAEEFAQKTAALLLDAERRRRLGEVARAFVVARFAWEAAAERVSAIERGRAGHRQVPVPVGTAAGAL